MIADLVFTPDLSEYGEQLIERGDVLQAAIEEKINILSATLLQSIQEKLSGEVLQQRTGTLIRSVEMQAAEWAGQVCQTSVGIDDGAPSFKYAIAFEMGGLGYYDIFPVNGLALAFTGGPSAAEGIGNGAETTIFTKHVHHPPAQKRAFIAPSVEELRPIFFAELQQVLDVVLGGEA